MMQTITATVAAQDRCDPDPEIRLVRITSNQPEDAPGFGDGSTAPDIDRATYGTGDRSFRVRAERDGMKQRVYTVVYSATDESGNVGYASATVTVPGNRDELPGVRIPILGEGGIPAAWRTRALTPQRGSRILGVTNGALSRLPHSPGDPTVRNSFLRSARTTAICTSPVELVDRSAHSVACKTSAIAIVPVLDDPVPRVRRNAADALGCVACKPTWNGRLATPDHREARGDVNQRREPEGPSGGPPVPRLRVPYCPLRDAACVALRQLCNALRSARRISADHSPFSTDWGPFQRTRTTVASSRN